MAWRPALVKVSSRFSKVDTMMRLGRSARVMHKEINLIDIFSRQRCARISEGLLEGVPGGYRYVYDGIFDFVVSSWTRRSYA
jgi:hypothetical protein